MARRLLAGGIMVLEAWQPQEVKRWIGKACCPSDSRIVGARYRAFWATSLVHRGHEWLRPIHRWRVSCNDGGRTDLL